MNFIKPSQHRFLAAASTLFGYARSTNEYNRYNSTHHYRPTTGQTSRMTSRPSGLRSIGYHISCKNGTRATIARWCSHRYIGSPTGCTSGNGLPIPLYSSYFIKSAKRSSGRSPGDPNSRNFRGQSRV